MSTICIAVTCAQALEIAEAFLLPFSRRRFISEYFATILMTLGSFFLLVQSQAALAQITSPTQIAPANNVQITTTSVTFSWSHPYPDQYELKIKNSGGAFVYVSGKTSAKSKTVNLGSIPLNYGSTYKWYVVVYANNLEASSSDRYFTYNADAVNPVVNSFTVNTTAIKQGEGFSFNYTVTDGGGSNLKQTELWRSTDGNSFSQVSGRINSHSGGSASGSFTDSPAAGIYWYGMHVVDNAGNWAAETSAQTKQVRVVQITKPTLNSPSDNASVTAAATTFNWSHPYNDQYELIIKDPATGAIVHQSGYVDTKSATANWTSPSSGQRLIFGKQYKWYVVVKVNGVTDSSVDRFFIYNYQQVTKPTLDTPADNASIITASTVFSWSHPYNDQYELVIKNPTTGAIVHQSGYIGAKNSTVNWSDLSTGQNLTLGKQYKWYVVVRVNGVTDSSVDRVFTYSYTQVTKPSLDWPGNNASVTTTSTTFSWSHPYNDQYELIVKDVASGAIVHQSGYIGAKSSTVAWTNLASGHTPMYGKQYKWYVVVKVNGVTDSSVDRYFTYTASEQTPPEPVTGPATDLPPSSDSGAIVITHGWNSSTDTWVRELAGLFCQASLNSAENRQLLACNRNGWDVWIVDWRNDSGSWWVPPAIAWAKAIKHGDELANTLFRMRYQKLHLIAHSAGANLIDSATRGLVAFVKEAGSSQPLIQATFLDAYDPRAKESSQSEKGQVSTYGLSSDDYPAANYWAENYVDTRRLTFNVPQTQEVLKDWTKLYIPNAYNVDITPVPEAAQCPPFSLPIPILKPVDEVLDDSACDHSRAYRFYGRSVDSQFFGLDSGKNYYVRDPIASTLGLGFALSQKNGHLISELNLSHPKGQKCRVSGGQCVTNQVLANPSLIVSQQTYNATVSTSTGGANWQQTSGNSLLNLQTSPLAPRTITSPGDARTKAVATESPSWMVVNLTTAGPVDTLTFDWRFTAGGEGFLRIFVNGDTVREIDQRYVTQTSQQTERVYVGGEAGILPPGTHRIGFRLDGFSTGLSGIELTGIKLGLTTLNAPLDATPEIVAIASRKTHGAAGTFDLPLAPTPLSPTTEPRTPGASGAHTIVFTFDKAITSGIGSVTAGTASVGIATFSGNEMTVNLTGVNDQQYVTLAVSNVVAADGGSGGSGTVRIGFLVGDVNGSRLVNSTDILTVKSSSGAAASALNFKSDLNASGLINSTDILTVKASSGHTLPTP